MSRNPKLFYKKPREVYMARKTHTAAILALKHFQLLEVVWRCSSFKLKLLYRSFPKKCFRGLIFTEWIKIKANFVNVKCY